MKKLLFLLLLTTFGLIEAKKIIITINIDPKILNGDVVDYISTASPAILNPDVEIK